MNEVQEFLAGFGYDYTKVTAVQFGEDGMKVTITFYDAYTKENRVSVITHPTITDVDPEVMAAVLAHYAPAEAPVEEAGGNIE